ncbi:MAG: non-specific endonuclease [Mucilaginibacter sp.]|nr:non-specific endonuclease [Mucilaginibacter sp.]
MKNKNLLFVAFIFLIIASCKKSDTPVTNKPPLTSTQPQNYAITEHFDNGSKTAYTDAAVALTTGQWDFNDALLGSLATDVKNGKQSVRLRTGSITTNFDINGVKQISIEHAKYGSDANSTWQLMMSTDGGATFTKLGNDISETSATFVTDSFKVTTTSKVRFRIQKIGTTRINIDDITFKGTGDPGITVGPPDAGGPDTTGTSKPTGDRGITAGADAPPATGDNSDLLMGNPSAAQTSIVLMDNYLMDQKYYSESYSSTRGTPNWVSWHLDASNITNASARLNNFAGFNGLPTGWYEVQSNSYSGSGFDRGHNCPSADRTSSTDANSATFLMANMIPQAPQNNEQTWANLENYLREQVVAGNEIYIIMGSYGSGGTGSNGSANTINNGHVNVPSNVWKVAVIIPVGDNDLSRITSTTRVIAVNTPNNNIINSDWTKYIVSVRDIESATGYNLLSSLPQNVQDAIEIKKDPGN